MALKPNYYETLYVVRPDLKEDELSKIQSKLPEFIEAHDGEIMRSDKWAERELAYEIQDHTRGVYYIMVFKALPTVTKDIEKHLKFYNTDVLRFMTVKINEEAAVREKNAAYQADESTPDQPGTPEPGTAAAPEAPATEPEPVAEAQQVEQTEPEAAPEETTENLPSEETQSEPEAEVQAPQEETAAQEEPQAPVQSEDASESEEGEKQ